jgi:hypothetical protein
LSGKVQKKQANIHSLLYESCVDLFDIGNWVNNSLQYWMEHTASEFIAFCERHKFTEGTVENSADQSNKAKPKASLKKSSYNKKLSANPSVDALSNKNMSSSDKWCDLHQLTSTTP